MEAAPQSEQAKLWNSTAGNAWVELQGVLDHVFAPFEDLLVETVSAGATVLDVGCGAGATTLAAARRVGEEGCCVGVDISEPLIAAARMRAKPEGASVTFICADAQTYAFDPRSFDVVISRFGVMFFDDVVQAFANLRRAAKDGAELRVAVWRSAAENPFMTTAERAAAPFLPNIPVRNPDGPGQFAFADQSKVRHILEESGWGDIDMRLIDVPCAFPEKELVRYLTRLGPLGLVFSGADERMRAEVVGTVRAAFDRYVHGAKVRFVAACWMIGARA